MSDPALWIGLVSVVAMAFFATALLAVRKHSRARLEEQLKRRSRSQWLERFPGKKLPLLLACATMETAAIVAMVLAVAHGFAADDVSDGWHRNVPAFLVSCGLLVVFGMTVPLAAARYVGERFLSHTLPILYVLLIALWPIIQILSVIDRFARKAAGARDNANGTPTEQAEQEIMDIVSEREQQGLVDEQEKNMIESVLEFHDANVAEIMTPRTDMVGVPADETIETVRDLVKKTGHSRFPVYEESIDHILGVLYVKDLLLLEPGKELDIRKIVRKVPFIPDSKPLRELLRQLQDEKVHLAIVLDEYGGTAGLVTIEDIVEELVGEITDEHDRAQPEPICRIDDDTVEIDARLHIDDLNEELDVDIPESEDYETVGGFVFATLGKIPRTGEEFAHDNLHIHVLDAEERKINRLRVHVNRETPDESS